MQNDCNDGNLGWVRFLNEDFMRFEGEFDADIIGSGVKFLGSRRGVLRM